MEKDFIGIQDFLEILDRSNARMQRYMEALAGAPLSEEEKAQLLKDQREYEKKIKNFKKQLKDVEKLQKFIEEFSAEAGIDLEKEDV